MGKSYRDLEVWKKGLTIVNQIYELTRRLPRSEIFGLSSQMRRSAVSIPANIAEGFARQHNREFKQFLYIALGSCAELETFIFVCSNLRYITPEEKDKYLELFDHESRMLMNLVKSIAKTIV